MLMRTSFGYFLNELSLTAMQAGIANAIVSATVCISALLIGSFAGNSRLLFYFISSSLGIVAISEFLLSNASDFATVLVSRVVLGIGCGPLFALIIKTIEYTSNPITYPRNTGIVSNGEAIINTISGPVITVYLLNRIGFRNTNMLYAFILFFFAILWAVAGNKIELPQIKKVTENRWLFFDLIKNKNLLRCLFSGALTLVTCWCIYMYAPTLLKECSNLSDSVMSLVMTLMGICMSVWMVILPIYYSKCNSIKIIVIGCLLSLIGVGALAIGSENWIFIIIFIVFGGLSSVMSLFFMAILSVKCVNPEQSAYALSMLSGGCELFGASLGPMIVGWIADKTNLKVSMLIAAVCMLFAGIIAGNIHIKLVNN